MKKIIITVIALTAALTMSAQKYESQRPAENERLFKSEIIELKIVEITQKLTNPKLAWMFANCFPNTLDTTVHYNPDGHDGQGDTFVITGDIEAMWLRDSGAQVWPYIPYATYDNEVRKMIAGTILRQFDCINIDPYANAFNYGPTGCHWASDKTGTKIDDRVHERKWEIDSHCYPIRLAYEYWKVTGDSKIFGKSWLKAMDNILETLKTQQRKKDDGPYYFLRNTDRQLDTKCNQGWGNPVNPCGLIVSSFRPSDDATTFDFLIPSNFFAVQSLRQAAEILTTVNGEKAMAKECTKLADEVEKALKKHAVVKHPKFGKIYAFEVDGFGNCFMMDDSNIPSLASLAYLGAVDINDPIYQNTRDFVYSEWNPYFFKGKAGEGVGGPHCGYDMIWPMSIMMRAFTSQNDKEIKQCIETLMTTDAGTGFMHESFHKDNPKDFTRSWFAWQNSLFGELIIKLINDGKLELLNSITVK
ncbi:MAG: glycoside hydrolase family 125 protein [Bacteroidales bacterium]|nr:glycoside hydrolase family 125 protein [Bacteroidales bacterium]